MGHFYTKIILQGLNQDSLADYLNLISRKTYVSPTINGFTIVYDQKSEGKSQELFQLTCQLSNKFGCSALAILVRDDLILHYKLYQAGEMKDEYLSNIGFHNPEVGDYPEGGNAQKLCSILGANNAASKVRVILNTPSSSTDYSNASLRLTKLVKALGISSFWATDCVGGYQDIERGSITPVTKKDPSPELALSLVKKTG
jgi:hypothetical protein